MTVVASEPPQWAKLGVPSDFWAIETFFSRDSRFAGMLDVDINQRCKELWIITMDTGALVQIPGTFEAACFTGDCREIVALMRNPEGAGSALHIFDVETKHPVRVLPNPCPDNDKVSAMVTLNDNSAIVLASLNGVYYTISLTDGAVLSQVQRFAHVSSIALTPDGTTLVAIHYRLGDCELPAGVPSLAAWSAATGALLLQVSAKGQDGEDGAAEGRKHLTISPDGRTAVMDIGYDDSSTPPTVVSLEGEGAILRHLYMPGEGMITAIWDPDSRTFFDTDDERFARDAFFGTCMDMDELTHVWCTH